MFKPRVATAVASYFLERSPEHLLNDIKLMKLMYLAERESLEKFTSTITGSRLVSMRHGPVLSDAYKIMRDDTPNSFWRAHVRYLPYSSGEVSENSFKLLKPVDAALYLSEGQMEILADVWEKFGVEEKWKLRHLTHMFPEWNAEAEASNTSIEMPLSDVFSKGLGYDDAEALEMQKEIEYYEAL